MRAKEYIPGPEGERESLVVSLFGDDDEIRLQTGPSGYGYRLLEESDGIGPAPVEHTSTPIASGGSVLRHQRFDEGTMYLVIKCSAPSGPELHEMVDRLTRILSPAEGGARLGVWSPYSQESRSRTVYYESGLESTQWRGALVTTFGITVKFFDPWWYGDVRRIRSSVIPIEKKFITSSEGHPEKDVGFYPIDLEHPKADSLFPARTVVDATFDGSGAYAYSVLSTEGITYEWAGEPHQSESIKKVDGVEVARNLIHDPKPSVLDNWLAQRGSVEILEGGGIRITASGESGQTRLDTLSDIRVAVEPGKYVAYSVDFRSPDGYDIYAHSMSYSGNTYTNTSFTTDYINSTDWTRSSASGLIKPGDTSFHVRLRIDSQEVPEGIRADFRNIIVATADTEAEALAQVDAYFDGDTPDIPSGAVDASTVVGRVVYKQLAGPEVAITPGVQSEIPTNLRSLGGTSTDLGDGWVLVESSAKANPWPGTPIRPALRVGPHPPDAEPLELRIAAVELLDGSGNVLTDAALELTAYDTSGETTSVTYETKTDPLVGSYEIPFFPIWIGGSVVQGELELKVEGDALAWPTWTIVGPGEDFTLSNKDGDEIHVEGTVSAPIEIITFPQHDTIREIDGPTIWDRVPLEQGTFFPLPPGENTVNFTMVNSNGQSSVELEYMERWKGAY